MVDLNGSGRWRVSHSVDLGLIAGLLLNAALGIWYASKLDSRVTNLENTAVQTSVSLDKIKDTSAVNETRLTRVEDHSESILEIVRRLEERKDPFPPEQPHQFK